MFHITCKSFLYQLYYLWRELIRINIELKDHNRLKEFFQNIHSKLEDLLFSIIHKIPEKFIPSPLMNWLSRYLDKRINELKQQSIKMTWQNMYLQDAVDDIHSRQQDIKKAPSENWFPPLVPYHSKQNLVFNHFTRYLWISS